MPNNESYMRCEPDRMAERLLKAATSGADVLSRMTADDALWRDRKADGSFVTAADMASDAAIRETLAQELAGVAIISEENPEASCGETCFILVDPLDGTAEFLRGGTEFAVAIALVIDRKPVAGAIVAPRLGRAWWGGEASWQAGYRPGEPILVAGAAPLSAREHREEGAIALVSRLHGDDWTAKAIAELKPAELRPVSSAVKFGMIASGEAQFHIRCGPTMEWDVAAGDAILRAAGGCVRDLHGRCMSYGHAEKNFRNPAFVAAAGPRVMEEALAAVQRVS